MRRWDLSRPMVGAVDGMGSVMLERFKSYRLANELKASQYDKSSAKSVRDRRALVSIGVIDDSPFEPKQNLKNVGYRVVLLGDVSKIDIVSPHHIILCDLRGVGRSLGARTQGAFVIREIRANYPEKYVIAYTGGAASDIISREALQVSDFLLKKDTDIDTWVDKLDSIILRLLNPYEVWQRQRKALVDRGVDTLTILKLEDAFVRSIVSRSEPEASPLARILSSDQIAGDVRALVRSLIASGLFRLLVG
jgi:hypothetical protein